MTIGRHSLPHDLPPTVVPDPGGEAFFLTLCCQPRHANQLAVPASWDAIRESALHREQAGDWRVTLLLAMPDHLHALCSFPGAKAMRQVVHAFKSWLARHHRIDWQRDFFDHRLRLWESAAEKRAYILQNPVRAGLVVDARAWPYVMDRFPTNQG